MVVKAGFVKTRLEVPESLTCDGLLIETNIFILLLSTTRQLTKVHCLSRFIENVNYSKRSDVNAYGSFSVVIRSLFDSDSAPKIIERYDNCNLNPNSANYVARKIGDQYYEWDNSKKRLVEYGTYRNNSRIVRIEMASEDRDWET